MDKLRNMRALVTVVKLGSFSAAARELGVTPGMMSKQIKYLEDELDVRLLHRTTRGVAPTDAGELYVDQALDILQRLDDADSAVANLAQRPRGVLRLSCPPSFGTHVLTKVIAAFAEVNPDIRIELGLQDDEPDVIAARLDILFRLGHLRDSSLVASRVGRAPFALCASPGYLARYGQPASLDELQQANCIVDGSIQLDGRWEFVCDQRRVGQPISGNFLSYSTEAVIEAAIEGLGLVYVPRYALRDELANGQLLELRLPDCSPISLPIYALYGSREHLASKIRTFLEFYSDFIIGSPDVSASQDDSVERRSHGQAPARKLERADELEDEIAT